MKTQTPATDDKVRELRLPRGAFFCDLARRWIGDVPRGVSPLDVDYVRHLWIKKRLKRLAGGREVERVVTYEDRGINFVLRVYLA